MNIYTTTIFLSIIAYVIVGNYVGRKVKGLEDYFVVGRQAPVLLISGTRCRSGAADACGCRAYKLGNSARHVWRLIRWQAVALQP